MMCSALSTVWKRARTSLTIISLELNDWVNVYQMNTIFRTNTFFSVTFMSSSVMKPTCTDHHGKIGTDEIGFVGRRSLPLLRKNPNFRPDLVWFIRSMYWFRPMPKRRRPDNSFIQLRTLSYRTCFLDTWNRQLIWNDV